MSNQSRIKVFNHIFACDQARWGRTVRGWTAKTTRNPVDRCGFVVEYSQPEATARMYLLEDDTIGEVRT